MGPRPDAPCGRTYAGTMELMVSTLVMVLEVAEAQYLDAGKQKVVRYICPVTLA